MMCACASPCKWLMCVIYALRYETCVYCVLRAVLPGGQHVILHCGALRQESLQLRNPASPDGLGRGLGVRSALSGEPRRWAGCGLGPSDLSGPEKACHGLQVSWHAQGTRRYDVSELDHSFNGTPPTSQLSDTSPARRTMQRAMRPCVPTARL